MHKKAGTGQTDRFCDYPNILGRMIDDVKLGSPPQSHLNSFVKG